VPGGLGGLLLGGLLGASAAAAVDRAAQQHRRREGLGVVGTLVLHPVDRRAEPQAGAQLLEAGLPVQGGTAGRGHDQQRVEQPVHETARGLQATADVHGADQGLERVGQDRVLLPAAGGLLTASQQQVGTDAAVAQPARDPGQRRHVDHGGTQFGQLTFGEVGLAAVELVGDDQAEHRVAQEFQALVGRQATVLVGEGPVGQRQAEQTAGQFDAEGVVQPGGGPLEMRGAAGRTDGGITGGVIGDARCRARSAGRHRHSRSSRGRQTDRTWRPWYWPQFGQAWCGGLGWPQALFGQGARVGAVAFHIDRRERVLARDIFRFGTATVSSPQWWESRRGCPTRK
jgi:hypothetical protein